MMAPTPEQLEAFAPLEWAIPYLTSPDWIIRERSRGSDPSTDQYNRVTLAGNDGVHHWIELHPRPAPGESVQRSLSLIKFGHGFGGFPGICHGGAILTLMDEALAYIWIANIRGETDLDLSSLHKRMWTEIREQRQSLAEVLKGSYVTAKLDVKFLQPVPCPGVVGIEAEAIEIKEHKMRLRAVMKDSKGTSLLQADAVWVKIGGAAKL
jgi:acyl-coenzyme A thioesterase PaaI-like protein